MNVRQTFALVAVAAVGAVAFLPSTAWLARLELKTSVAGVAALGQTSNPSAAVAARSPERFDLQLAAAGDDPAKLASVAARFPDRPAAHAAVAVALTRAIDLSWRPEGYTIGDEKPPVGLEKRGAGKFRASDIDNLVAASAAGARLEPDNGFFPMMEAVGHLAAGRDRDARLALGRAASAPRWDEHVADTVRTRWALAEAAYGPLPVLNKTAIAAAALYPHYAPLRSAARVFVVRAIEREKAGDTEAGIALRRDLLAVGSAMRRESSPLIGSLVGNAICALSTTRPGGAPMVKHKRGGDAEALRVQAERAAQWERWSRASGHPELAGAAAQSQAHRKATQGLFEAAGPGNPMDMAGLMREMVWIGAGLALLATALWSVLLGGLFHALGRHPRVRAGEPLPEGVKMGLRLGVAELILVPLTLALGGNSDLQLIGALCCCAAPLMLVTLALLKNEASVGVTLARLAGGVFSLLGAVAVAGMLSVGSMASLSAVAGMDKDRSQAMAIVAVGGAVAFVVPLLVIAALSIVAKVRRVPAGAQIVRGFPRIAVPLASVLLLAWAAQLLPLSAFEDRLQAGIAQVVAHEGRTLARAAGRAWPGDR